MKRKLISLSIILCFILPFMIAITSNATENDVSFSIASMNVQKGETIIVKVNMNCINSFNAGNFVISYDSSVLEYAPYLDSQNHVVYTQNKGETIASIGNIAINGSETGKIKIGYMAQNSIEGENKERRILKT